MTADHGADCHDRSDMTSRYVGGAVNCMKTVLSHICLSRCNAMHMLDCTSSVDSGFGASHRSTHMTSCILHQLQGCADMATRRTSTSCAEQGTRQSHFTKIPAIAIPAPLPSAAITTFGSSGLANATDSKADPVKLNSMLPRNSAHKAITYLVFEKCSAWV